MGKMKELFIEQQNEAYNGSHDLMIEDLARQTVEEYIIEGDTPCPNCNQVSLLRNESNAKCTECSQKFIYIGNALRFI